MIRDVVTTDAQAIADIYNHYIAHSVISFEEEVLDTAEMVNRIGKVTTAFPWLVFEDGDEILGYAYANTWQTRCAYRQTVESSIYLRQDATGRGMGNQLYKALLSRLGELDIHCIIAGIALPNPASIALHEKLGFEKSAHYKEVGRKFDKWIDVGYWQLILANAAPSP